MVESVNLKALDQLPGDVYAFNNLLLKIGAKVILTRSYQDQKLFMGMQGEIVNLEKKQVTVKFKDLVHPVQFVSGSLPLKLGYAFSVHEAQGKRAQENSYLIVNNKIITKL